MPDIVYRVVQTTTKVVDITIPEEVAKQGFDVCKKHAIETAIVFNFAPNIDVKETTDTKAFIRQDGL
jgi:hypothetical protein